MLLTTIKKALLILAKYFDSLCRYLPRIGRFQPTRGVFSALDRLKSGEMDGEFVLQEQMPGVSLPKSVTELVACRQHDHQPWPIFWAKSNKARLVGSMLYWRDPEDYICKEGSFNTVTRRRLGEDRLFAQTLLEPTRELPGAWTSILSNWGQGGNYYHWLCDSLTRLLVREHLPEETRILIPRNPSSFVRESLELLNLTEQCTEAPHGTLRPETYYFCSPTAMTGVWNPVGFNWLRDKFKSQYTASEISSPLFLTRRGTSRIPRNIQAIEGLMQDHGFTVIDCCDYSVLEQIHMLNTAPAVAGLHGAALTNLLWAKPGTPVMEIFEPQYLNACFEQIARQGELCYRYVINDDRAIDTIQKWIKSIHR